VAVEKFQTRQTIGDTDIGIKLKDEIEELEQLLAAYRSGELVEKR
jgi:fructose-1,6-bisphosphatase-3